MGSGGFYAGHARVGPRVSPFPARATYHGAVKTRPALLAVLLLAAACTSVPVTPAGLLAATPEEPGAQQALVLWAEAVDLANEFLASDSRTTLDPGHFELGGDGLRYLTAEDVHPIEVRVTTWGGLCNDFGFEAQERSWGFVVGARGPGSPLTDNSLFRLPHPDAPWRHPALIAELILHETTHVVYEVGTVSFWKGVGYYLEVIFLWRYDNHSDERLPFATSNEFLGWYTERS